MIKDLLKRQKSDKIAIKFGNEVLTYYDWDVTSNKIANLLKQNLPDNSLSIALYLPNSINYAIAYFGVLYADKVIVPIGIQAKEPELLSTIEYCEVDLIITDTMHCEYVQKCLQKNKYRVIIYVVDNSDIIIINSDKDVVTKSDAISLSGNEDDVVIMLHTSGTTNAPKRVMLTNNNLISNIMSNVESLKLTKNDKVLISLPMYFGYCNTSQFLTHIFLGASMVILDSVFMPKLFFKIVQEEKITNFTAVPTLLLLLLDYKYSDKYDFSSLRYICFGGSKMPLKKLEEIILKYPSIGFVQTYGQTECSPRVTALLPNDSLRKIGSVGLPLPGVSIMISNMPQNSESDINIGEIMVKGSNVMKGYFKQDKMNKEILSDVWLHTGDLGYLDEEGYLYITGRLRNVLISGGINVYPEEIEELLLTIPNISDAYVFPKEDYFLGEVPIAQIVVTKKIDLNEVKKYCQRMLADYKVPKEIKIVNEIKKTFSGKIIRN